MINSSESSRVRLTSVAIVSVEAQLTVWNCGRIYMQRKFLKQRISFSYRSNFDMKHYEIHLKNIHHHHQQSTINTSVTKVAFIMKIVKLIIVAIVVITAVLPE